jgi:hypothetical protein
MFASEVGDKSTALGDRDERSEDFAVPDGDNVAVISDLSGVSCSILHPVREIRF